MEENEKDMFADGICPMLETDAIQRYGLSDAFVKRWCDLGCSVECGKLLQEHLKRKGIKPVEEDA